MTWATRAAQGDADTVKAWLASEKVPKSPKINMPVPSKRSGCPQQKRAARMAPASGTSDTSSAIFPSIDVVPSAASSRLFVHRQNRYGRSIALGDCGGEPIIRRRAARVCGPWTAPAGWAYDCLPVRAATGACVAAPAGGVRMTMVCAVVATGCVLGILLCGLHEAD